MQTYVFTGVVIPQRAYVNLEGELALSLNEENFGIAGTAILSIVRNQVTAVFHSENPISDIATLRNLIGENVLHVMNCSTLHTATYHDVDIISVHALVEGYTHVFGSEIAELSTLNGGFVQTPIQGLLEISNNVPLFKVALSDFNNAIKQAVDTGFLCYRATESLVHIFGSKKPAAIETLEAALNVDPACISFLRDLGGKKRHGHAIAITGKSRVEALRLVREMLFRFATYHRDPTECHSLPPLTTADG